MFKSILKALLGTKNKVMETTNAKVPTEQELLQRRQAKAALKADIKKLAAEQRVIRPQRKTVHFKGERTLSPDQAQTDHFYNRHQLRHLYIAYGYMRGKTIDQIEPKRKTPFSQYTVDQILKKYGGQ